MKQNEKQASGWHRVIGQERSLQVLRSLVASKRVGHAFLFYGPSGVGKMAAGLALAQALLCENDDDRPCGLCPACTKVLRGVHPDVRIHLPFPGQEPPSDLPARRALLAADPYARADFTSRPNLDDADATANKQTRYPIDYVHEELIRLQSFRPVEGRYRVSLVTEAHLLGERGSNALLKSLEEPPPRTVNILITDRPDQLLPTIVSRCEQVRFGHVEPDVIAGALVSRGYEHGAAAVASRMADGSLATAIDLATDEGLAERRQLVVEFMRLSYTQRAEQLGEVVARMTGEGREQLKAICRTLLDWVRDLLVFSETGEATRIVNVDYENVIADFCRGLPDADIPAMVGLVEESILLVERNVNTKLICTVLSQKLGRAMRGKSAGALFEPLVLQGFAAEVP